MMLIEYKKDGLTKFEYDYCENRFYYSNHDCAMNFYNRHIGEDVKIIRIWVNTGTF